MQVFYYVKDLDSPHGDFECDYVKVLSCGDGFLISCFKNGYAEPFHVFSFPPTKSELVYLKGVFIYG